jgi:2-keto-3-deoxy-6-phosphogluconate aldolase
VIPPPVAETVTFALPVVAVLLAERVRVELPLPGAAIDAGLKLAVTPAGNPEADRETAALKPPLNVVEIVELPELP